MSNFFHMIPQLSFGISSTLVFKHALFEENPCIPALLIHERKFETVHQQLFKHAKKLVL